MKLKLVFLALGIAVAADQIGSNNDPQQEQGVTEEAIERATAEVNNLSPTDFKKEMEDLICERPSLYSRANPEELKQARYDGALVNRAADSGKLFVPDCSTSPQALDQPS